MFKPKRIAVIGGTGFLGKHLVTALDNQGYEVVVLARDTHKEPLPRSVIKHDVDIRDTIGLRTTLAGCDTVFHLAAMYQIGTPDQTLMAAINIQGTKNVLEVAQMIGCQKLIYVSTTAVHGETNGEIEDENQQHNGTFRSYYEATKYLAHQEVLKSIAKGLPVTIVSPGGMFGEYDRGPIATLMSDFLTGKLPIMIKSNSRFTLTAVEDVANGLILALHHGALHREYILSQQPMSVKTLLTLVMEHSPLLKGHALPREVDPTLLRWPAKFFDHLSQLTQKVFPLNSEVLQVMDGSDYLYHSQRACEELGWLPHPFQKRFISYLEGFDAKI